ncbi:MAG: hypothetical protein ACKOGA_24715, partial [Planctomycetaceae bacterium]
MIRKKNWWLALSLGLGLAFGAGRASAWQESSEKPGDKGGEKQVADELTDRIREVQQLFPRTKSGKMSPAQLDEAQEKLQALVDDKVPPASLMMLRQGLVQQQLNAGRMQDALGHLLANVEFLRVEGKTAP